MYHYKASGRHYTGGNESKYKPLFFLSVVALIVVIIILLTGGGGIQENEYITQRNSRLRAEVQKAMNSVNSLSRLGASSSPAVLGKVRQYVHGMEVINDMNVGIYGEVGRIYSQSTFDSIYSIIDEYDSKLSSGSKVNEVLTSLSNIITELYNSTMVVVQ